ncbi:MAG: UbiA family prenyltransferase [Verrucomicrobia bacterium]|nr:UbiA family prenyltransferase [Verrucomicrobiota bacterium]MCF7708176.1 UbiA family prenyltransferase [Verrucomicrobiota bacterium]
MWPTRNESLHYLKTVAALGHLRYLPTVWSNCLAGWLLSGGGNPGLFIAVFLGVNLTYLGGAILNDACDASHDAIYNRNRPIPSGGIELQTVLILSLICFIAGALFLIPFGKVTAILTVLLIGIIVLNNLVHKIFLFSPVLLGLCRLMVYLIAGAASAGGLYGLTVWSGIAMMCYAAGAGLLERINKGNGTLSYPWIYPLLCAPVLLALLVNSGGFFLAALAGTLLFCGWNLWALRPLLEGQVQSWNSIGQNLLAGVVLADALAVAGGGWGGLIYFTVCFIATLAARRILQFL